MHQEERMETFMTEERYANRFDDTADDWHRTGTAHRQADSHNALTRIPLTAESVRGPDAPTEIPERN